MSKTTAPAKVTNVGGVIAPKTTTRSGPKTVAGGNGDSYTSVGGYTTVFKDSGGKVVTKTYTTTKTTRSHTTGKAASHLSPQSKKIIGIVIGVVVGVILLSVIAFFLFRRLKRKRGHDRGVADPEPVPDDGAHSSKSSTADVEKNMASGTHDGYVCAGPYGGRSSPPISTVEQGPTEGQLHNFNSPQGYEYANVERERQTHVQPFETVRDEADTGAAAAQGADYRGTWNPSQNQYPNETPNRF